jgi:Lon protease-like protein
MSEPSRPLLSLFPLEVVLFPGSKLPLHIFEPRYRKLIHDCLETDSEFGMVLVEEKGVAEVGCTAHVDEVVKRHEDGRMDIIVEGRRRFEILYQNHEEEVLRAEVEFFDDEKGDDATALKELVEATQDLYTKIAQAVVRPHRSIDIIHAQPPHLAFAIVGRLGAPLEFCQTLLSMRTESERLKELNRFLRDALPKIELRERIQKKAGGNGHLT